ncbi:hypothetical protein KL937_000543 [Ogataea polymorpha]|uniref:uncharacterized protein n=1 Tax=Ogataea polymorpha TaxID=460523 RepID=UPI0007F3FE3E|nr:uncharacterized protein OGAPODRAFT_50649 [Ogataea polymorpha]KAG7883370.1 hypothetical protein KL937_000543 [Ogataea polymorpha]KAG7896057.1 hypothetical protein KL936_000765 [Ogataea polymorpha]KAG7940142.1 hypothetical protein KL904_000005 [Ogataea polymorpha]OBA14636.1 hypothetical protein OGAPODRAFT_50649 [Ogataea polymorpha]
MTIPTVETQNNFEPKFVNPPGPVLAPNVLDLFSLKNKVCVVTGAGRGIGYHIAEAYAQAGGRIAVWDYEEPAKAAAKISESTGAETKSYGCDVGDQQKVKETVDQIVKDFGTIDVFVANAGIHIVTDGVIDALDEDGSRWSKVMNVNLNGVYNCSKAVGRIFKERGSGSLIFTGSMSGHIVNIPIHHAAYNTSKAGVIHFAKCLAMEFKDFARVNTVSPGYIDSGINNHVDPTLRKTWQKEIPLGREGYPRELIGAYLYFASDASTYATGSDLIVDGGYTIH